MLKALRYTTPPTIRWSQERASILVIDEASDVSARLVGLEAAVWKWISLGYRERKLLILVQTFLNQTMDEARERLNQILNLWVEIGLMNVDEETAGAERVIL